MLNLLAVGLLSQLAKHLMGGCAAQVGANQRSFQIIEGRSVDFLAKRNHLLDALAEVLPCAGYRLFHPLQEAGFFLGTAKKSLNHKMPTTPEDQLYRGGRRLCCGKA